MVTEWEGAYAKYRLSHTICSLFWHGRHVRTFLVVLSGACHRIPEDLTIVANHLIDR